MSLSLNETHKLVKDAARGCGMPWGGADELARAAVWLEVADLPGLTNACRAIDETLNRLAGHVQLTQRDGWRLAAQYAEGDGRIDALAAGTCACDLARGILTGDATSETIHIKSVFLPLLTVGLVTPLNTRPDQVLTVTLRDADERITATFTRTQDTVRIYDHKQTGRPSHPLVDVEIAVKQGHAEPDAAEGRIIWSPAIHQNALESGLSPNEATLDTLGAYAHNCLVPATEESRLKGAGAGTVDRD